MSSKTRGKVSRQGDFLSLEFGWHKQRFEIVKSFEGSFYCKESKSWQVPLKHFPAIEKSRYFSEAYFDCLFDKSLAKKDLSSISSRRELARNRLIADPFYVPREVLLNSEPDIAIWLHSSGVGVGFTLSSKASCLLAKIEGVCSTASSFISSQNLDSHCYFLPVMQVRNLIKLAKDNGLLFGVEETTGRSLSDTASLRFQVQLGYFPTEEELQKAHLIPFVSVDGNMFRIFHITSKQLKNCFPSIASSEERERKASCLTLYELLNVIYSLVNKPTKLWLSKDVLIKLQTKRDTALNRLLTANNSSNIVDICNTEINRDAGFDANLLSLIQPDCFWHCDYMGRSGLYIRKLLLQNELRHLSSTISAISSSAPCDTLHFPDFSFFTVSDSNLLYFHSETMAILRSTVVAYYTNEFVLLLNDLRKRKHLISKREHFHALTDCQANCINKELESRLFPHQRIAVSWLKESPIAFLGDDMGLGKTLSVLAFYEDLLLRQELEFALIVCPNSLVSNWVREGGNWIPNVNISILPKSKKTREAFLEKLRNGSVSGVDALVINYETLRLEHVYPTICEFMQYKKSIVVLDESQRAKNAQTKIFFALSRICSLATRRILLSGTPTPKELSDIWSQMYLLDGGERFGTNFLKWLSSVAEIGNKWNDYAVKSYKLLESQEAIRRVHEVLLRRKKNDVVSLPDKLFSTRDVELVGDQLKRYNQVRKELLYTISSCEGEKFTKEIGNILEEYLRAVQIASNPRLVDPAWNGVPAKFQELDEIVREIVLENEQSLVIWTNYLLNVAELVDRYKNHEVASFSGDVDIASRAKIIEDFQVRKIKILVAIPAAGGVGITLTAAQTAVYVDKTWNGEHWMQSVDRLHRIGQNGTVNIISLHAAKVDKLISRNLEKKARQQDALFSSNGLSLDDAMCFGASFRDELIDSLV